MAKDQVAMAMQSVQQIQMVTMPVLMEKIHKIKMENGRRTAVRHAVRRLASQGSNVDVVDCTARCTDTVTSMNVPLTTGSSGHRKFDATILLLLARKLRRFKTMLRHPETLNFGQLETTAMSWHDTPHCTAAPLSTMHMLTSN